MDGDARAAVAVCERVTLDLGWRHTDFGEEAQAVKRRQRNHESGRREPWGWGEINRYFVIAQTQLSLKTSRGSHAGSARSILIATFTSSPGSTTSANQERLPRCGTLLPDSSAATSSTATSSPITASPPGRGRSGSTRRNSARASVSGVAPARSRAGSASVSFSSLPSV